jgi:hypothetical protein
MSSLMISYFDRMPRIAGYGARSAQGGAVRWHRLVYVTDSDVARAIRLAGLNPMRNGNGEPAFSTEIARPDARAWPVRRSSQLHMGRSFLAVAHSGLCDRNAAHSCLGAV